MSNIQQDLLSTEGFLRSQSQKHSHPRHFYIGYTQHEIPVPMDGFSFGTISYCHVHFRPLQLFRPSWVTVILITAKKCSNIHISLWS